MTFLDLVKGGFVFCSVLTLNGCRGGNDIEVNKVEAVAKAGNGDKIPSEAEKQAIALPALNGGNNPAAEASQMQAAAIIANSPPASSVGVPPAALNALNHDYNLKVI